MPCQCDYLEPVEREIESKKVCQLLQYLISAAKLQVHPDKLKNIEVGARQYYGDVSNVDANTALLCQLLQELPEDVASIVIYDGRNPEARKLADWWDKHKIADAQREAKEERQRKKDAIRDQAIKKLTTEEVEALGIRS